MTNELIIEFRGAVMHGAAGKRARAVAAEYFEAAKVTPLDAATGAFMAEGPYELSQRMSDAANVWWGAPEAVAFALGVEEADISVNLDRGL